jgi:hypothetical protein
VPEIRFFLKRVFAVFAESKVGLAFFSVLASLISRVASRTRTHRGASSSVYLLKGDEQMFRFNALANRLLELGIRVEVIQVNFLAGQRPSHATESRGKSEPPTSVKSRTLKWWSIRDWIESQSMGVIFFSQPYLSSGTLGPIASKRNSYKIYTPYSFGIVENGAELTFGRRTIESAQMLTVANTRMLARGNFRNKQSERVWGYPELGALDKNLSTGSLDRILWAPHWTSLSVTSSDVENQLISWGEALIRAKHQLEGKGLGCVIRVRPHPRILDASNRDRVMAWLRAKVQDGSLESLSTENTVATDFNWSSSLVHNSGSFVAEYAATGKPAFFLTENSEVDKNLSVFGRELFAGHYKFRKAHSFDRDLLNWSEGLDPLKDLRVALTASIHNELTDFESNAVCFLMSLLEK